MQRDTPYKPERTQDHDTRQAIEQQEEIKTKRGWK